MIIRKAIERDLKACAEIFWIESSKPPYNKKRTFERALKIIKEDFRGNDIYVSIADSKVIGFVMVQKDTGIKNQLWIYEIWISKEYQGRGVGGKLMEEIENIYKQKGIKIFELVANTRNGGAAGFYRKLGYNKDGSMIFMEKRVRRKPLSKSNPIMYKSFKYINLTNVYRR